MVTFTFEEQRDYPIPPLAWHETHRNSSTIETCSDGVMDVKNVRSWV